MTSDRKKPGVAFWATVGLVVVLAYPLCWGPLYWFHLEVGRPEWLAPLVTASYRPIGEVSQRLPECLREGIGKYIDWWRVKGRDAYLRRLEREALSAETR